MNLVDEVIGYARANAAAAEYRWDRETWEAHQRNCERVRAEIERLTAERDALKGNTQWAVNILLEKIAEKFEAWETYDIWRSQAAEVVRSFKHQPTLEQGTEGEENGAR